MSFIDDVINFLVAPIRGATIPESTLIVLAAAFLLSLMTTIANRFLVNYRMVTNYRREYMSWMKAVNKARKEGDEKQLEKLMRRQAAVMKMNWRATLESFKTMPITIIPFLLIYNVLLAAFGESAVAFSPLALPFAAASSSVAVLTLFYWYLICSFAISVPLSRVFGVQTFSMSPGESK